MTESIQDQTPQAPPLSFQEIVLTLMVFWAKKGCALVPTYDMEMGAGTSHPMTALRALGHDSWRTAFVQPSRRPGDGRYGDNPNRLQKFHQFQVLLKPAPENPQELLLQSYKALGLDLESHDIRFVQDDWENPSLGAAGLGWEVWIDGMEMTQFTYFQQMAGMECNPVSVELAYGLERIALCLQKKTCVWDLCWTAEYRESFCPEQNVIQGNKPAIFKNNADTHMAALSYKNLFSSGERQFCTWYLEQGNPEMLRQQLEEALLQGHKLCEQGLALPGWECCLRANHIFNMWEAMGAIGPVQRAHSIGRIRALAGSCAQEWLKT